MALMLLANKQVRNGLLVGGGLLSLGLAGWAISRSFGGKKNQRQTVKSATDERQRRERLGETQSHSDQQFQAFSDNLLVSFGQCGLSDPTDRAKDRIETILKEMNNTTDVHRLREVFGTRKTSGPWICPDGPLRTLDQFVAQELLPNRKKRINEFYAGRNIDWRWL